MDELFDRYKLFHKYKNKSFAYITNYINSCLNDDSLAVSSEEMRSQLCGESQRTFEEFIRAILNHAADGKINAALLYERDGRMQPIRQISVPVRATIAEKAWLYYILQNKKSDLFIKPDLKKRLLKALATDRDLASYPMQPDYVDLRSLSPDNSLQITPEYTANFQKIVTAIRKHRTLIITNNSYSGEVYTDQKVIPYKLEYSAQFDSFALSCCPLADKRPVKMNLDNLSKVEIDAPVENYEEFLQDFEQSLRSAKVDTPVTIEISNRHEAYDRCAYLFSSFDTYCYDKGNEKLIMNIYYYRFQKEEIIRNILFLGHYVKVTSPEDVKTEIISAIKKSYENYL